MPLVNIFESRKVTEAINDTWGHLIPTARKKYYGYMIIAVGAYADTIIVSDNFKDLKSSPWHYEDFHEFIAKETTPTNAGIYRLDGWYMKYKNGNYHIKGKFKKIDLEMVSKKIGIK